MIKIIKLGNLIYENIEAKYIDENGNEIWNVPNDATALEIAFKDTIDWYTTRYINEKFNQIDEDLSDITSEMMYLQSLTNRTPEQDARLAEIQNIIAWKEQIWAEEANLEAQIDNMTLDELLSLDVKSMCENAYSQISLPSEE